jgi:hypothetical protein
MGQLTRLHWASSLAAAVAAAACTTTTRPETGRDASGVGGSFPYCFVKIFTSLEPWGLTLIFAPAPVPITV